MPPTQQLLTHANYLSTNLIPVALPSAANPCPICQDAFSATSPPVLLRDCGHIFCQPCITAWFDSGLNNANTCPLDRQVLFSSSTAVDEGRITATVRSGRVRSVRPVVELFRHGEIIAVDGALTRVGCEYVVRDLWYHTARLRESLEEFCGEEVDAFELDIELLRSCVRSALPRGVRIGEEAWMVLFECTRRMLVWHGEGRNRWEGREWVPVEELRGFVESLHRACGEIVER